MKKFEKLWSGITRISAFGMGLLIMYHETFQDAHERPYLYLAAISLMGPQLAETISRALGTVDKVIGLMKSEIRSSPQKMYEYHEPQSKSENVQTHNHSGGEE